MDKVYKIEYYVPETHLEVTKKALFDAGAGRIENYDCCCWKTSGVGQFRPLVESDPYLGKTDSIESVKEYKVELVCAAEFLESSIKAMNQAHPYETPAYNYWPVNFTD